jgi:S-adenosylmethionine:tRNA ribosyltransferase-isomerase
VLRERGSLHASFGDLPAHLRAGDLLVLNETRVIAARLRGTRVPTGGLAELLLLHPADSIAYRADATAWIALARPARRLRAGARIAFGENGSATIRREMDGGMREIELCTPLPLEEFLHRAGRVPLPPYVHNDSEAARERYQTVFARVPGSVAAPTASLHFTPELLVRVRAAGVEIASIDLQVGLGTFRPIGGERIGDHTMHAEAYAIPEATAEAIERAQREKRRVVAAGTTVVRALEGNAAAHGAIVPGRYVTDCFITPGFSFRAVDALITNFHLPRSSLLVLVSAFAGREAVLRAYAEAVSLGYRFFSFGDAMLVERARSR